MSTRQSRFNVGDVIDGKYEVVKVLPAGGMGELYKVRHVHLNDFRAVKVLKKNLLSDATQKQRFLREAKIAASIKHPNLASLFDFSSLPDGSYYMVQEFIDGVTLADRMRTSEKFDTPFVVRVAQQVLSGIASLHEEGIIHRDISPDNLMLTRTSSGTTNIKIIDLGIAKPMDAGEGLTSAGFFVGKLHYASPEQAGMIEPGEKVDNRTDLYSLGVVLYQMVTGRMPFAADSPQSYFLKQVSEEVAPLNGPGEPPLLPPEIEQFVLKLLRRDRSERYASAHEALDHLNVIGPRAASVTAVMPAIAPTAPTPPPPFEEPGEEELARTVTGALSDFTSEPEKPAQADVAAPPPEEVFSSSFYGDETQVGGDEEEERITAERPLGLGSSSGWEAPAPGPDATLVAPPSFLPSDPAAMAPPSAPFGDSHAIAPDPGLRQSTLASQILGAAPAQPDDSASRRAPIVMPPAPPTPPSSMPTMVETPVPSALPTMVETPVPLRTIVESDPSSHATTVMPVVTSGMPAPGATPPPSPRTIVQTPVPPPVAGGRPVAMGQPKKGRSGLLIVFALLVLLLLGVAAGAAWYLFGRGEEQEPTDTVATAVETPVPTPIPTPMIVPTPMIDTMATVFTDTTLTDIPLTTPEPTATPRPSPRRRRSPTPTPVVTATPVPSTPVPTPPPPPRTREGDVVRQNEEGAVNARISKWASVTYPRAAERMRASGTTELQVLIGIDGSVEQIRVSKSSGFEILDDEAMKVARRSTYTPARKDNVRVRMWIPVRVTFERP